MVHDFEEQHQAAPAGAVFLQRPHANAKRFLPFRLVDDASENPVVVLKHLLQKQQYPRFVPFMSSFPYIQPVAELKIQPEQEGHVDDLPAPGRDFGNPYREYILQTDFLGAFQRLAPGRQDPGLLKRLAQFVGARQG